MELQLRLSLPTYSLEGYDLNNYVHKPKELVGSETCSSESRGKNKRGFHGAFENMKNATQKRPLLMLFNDQPNDDDGSKGPEKKFCYSVDENDEEFNGVIGWPPVKSWQKKLQDHHHPKGEKLNSTYVKVTMEGVAIGRKVNLSHHHSYETLIVTLRGMFTKYHQEVVNGLADGRLYRLTYQDKEGDWLLVGDVPWQEFIRSVLRLKIKRKGSE